MRATNEEHPADLHRPRPRRHRGDAAAAGCSNDLPVASRWNGRACSARASRSPPIRGGPRSRPARRRRSSGSSPGRARPPPSTGRSRSARRAARLRRRAAADRQGRGTPVTVAFTTPVADAGTGAPLMLGVVCADGTLGVDPNLPRRPAPAPAPRHARRFTVPVAPDGATPNRHPVFAQRRHRAGGRGVDPATATAAAPGDACDANRGLPVVAATPTGGAGSRTVDPPRQRRRRPRDLHARRRDGRAVEELQISNFATAGELVSSYAAIFATTAPTPT